MIADGCAVVFTIVPAPALGLEAETLLMVTVEPAKLNEVAARAHPPPRRCATSARRWTGTRCCARSSPPSTQGLFEFTTDTLAKLAGVVGWSASVELLSLKRGFVETPWWRDQLAEHHIDTEAATIGHDVSSTGTD